MELDQADYPDAKYWTLKEWQKHIDKANGDTNTSKLGFLCDEDGNPVSKDRIKAMADTARKLWSELYRHRYDPVTWRYVGKAADEYFTNNMRIAFPEFGLCTENWKVKMFATVRYPDWSTGSRGSGKLTSLTQFFAFITNADVLVLLGAVPSIKNHGNNTSIASKRVQEDDKENDSERDGTRDKRPRLQQPVTIVAHTTDTTRPLAPNNPKPSSTSKSAKRPSPLPRSKIANATDLMMASPPTAPSLAPVMNAQTPLTPEVRIQEPTDMSSVASTGSVTVAMQTPAAPVVPPAPSVLSLPPVATTSAQTPVTDVDMQGPPNTAIDQVGVPGSSTIAAMPATIATSTTSGLVAPASQTREVDTESQKSVSIGPITVAALESAPCEERNECDGSGTLVVSIIIFMAILLRTIHRNATITLYQVRITPQTDYHSAQCANAM